eukprot:g33684.t1
MRTWGIQWQVGLWVPKAVEFSSIGMSHEPWQEEGGWVSGREGSVKSRRMKDIDSCVGPRREGYFYGQDLGYVRSLEDVQLGICC